jgi:hypothetical protein
VIGGAVTVAGGGDSGAKGSAFLNTLVIKDIMFGNTNAVAGGRESGAKCGVFRNTFLIKDIVVDCLLFHEIKVGWVVAVEGLINWCGVVGEACLKLTVGLFIGFADSVLCQPCGLYRKRNMVGY